MGYIPVWCQAHFKYSSVHGAFHLFQARRRLIFVYPPNFMRFSNPNQPAGLLMDVYFCLDTNSTVGSLSGHFFP